MFRFRFAFLLALLFALQACAPAPTKAEPDAEALRFVELDRGEAAVVANAPMEYGTVSLAGEALVIVSPFCDLPDCVPNENGYIRLTYPDEPDADYGSRLEIDVVSGTLLQGRALMTLVGESQTRPAPLRLHKETP